VGATKTTSALFAWFISYQPAVFFSHNKPATSNQAAVLFSQNKPALAISHQPTEQAGRVLRRREELEHDLVVWWSWSPVRIRESLDPDVMVHATCMCMFGACHHEDSPLWTCFVWWGQGDACVAGSGVSRILS
jgi:hypothetical protein